MTQVILGVGSNRSWQGNDSLVLLKKACDSLGSILSDITVSSVYRTKPMYVENQQDFYNMALCGYVTDSISPFILLDKIHEIEASLGRDRSKEIRNGPRTIDIDIEVFGHVSINTETLQIPHPRISERAFVLIPVLEILNESADFIKREKYAEYLKHTGSDGVEKVLSSLDFVKIKA